MVFKRFMTQVSPSRKEFSYFPSTQNAEIISSAAELSKRTTETEIACEEAETAVEPEAPAAPEVVPEEEYDSAEDFRYALEDFFLEFSSVNGPIDGASGNEVQKEHSSSSSSEDNEIELIAGEKLIEKIAGLNFRDYLQRI